MSRPKHSRPNLPPHVHVVRAGGREYFYLQVSRNTSAAGIRRPLPGDPYDLDGRPRPEWWDAYRRGGREIGAADDNAPQTFARLIREFKQSPEWNEFGERTRIEMSRHLKRVEEMWGERLVRRVEVSQILKLRDAFASKPSVANNLMRSLSSMLSWSVPRGWIALNPCLRLRRLMLKSGKAYEPWDWEAITLFKQIARPCLWQAAAIALYTGQRRGDCLKMKWEDLRDGLISVEQSKTGKRLWIPVHRDLRTILDGILPTSECILTGDRGAWSSSGFQTEWAKQMGDERLRHLRARRYVFHGLRKSAVVMLLEAGCTDAEVSAITGQSREMVVHYAQAVSQRRLAAAAISKWESKGRGVSPEGEESR